MKEQAPEHPVVDEPPEADIDAVVAAFDGDMRAAIRSLLIANEFLISEVNRLRASLSVGYVRGRGCLSDRETR